MKKLLLIVVIVFGFSMAFARGQSCLPQDLVFAGGVCMCPDGRNFFDTTLVSCAKKCGCSINVREHASNGGHNVRNLF